jgi:hypothetical protein
MIESAYETLKISRSATPEEARNAFVKLVRRYPPERFPEKFMAIGDAYRQICLDDAFLDELCRTVTFDTNSAKFAGFLWGDRPELRERMESFAELRPLVNALEMSEKIKTLLETIDAAQIEWKGTADD